MNTVRQLSTIIYDIVQAQKNRAEAQLFWYLNFAVSLGY
jgi:hypothetical protein